MISFRKADLLDEIKREADEPKLAVEMYVEIMQQGTTYRALYGFKVINNQNIAANIKSQFVRFDYIPQQWTSRLGVIDNIAYVEQSGWITNQDARNNVMEFVNTKIKTDSDVKDAIVSFAERNIKVME